MDTSTIAKINYIRSVDIVAGNTLALQLALAEHGDFTQSDLREDIINQNNVMDYHADSLSKDEALVQEIQADIIFLHSL